MNYGLICRNNNDSVIISSDQYGLAFIGNATFTNTVKPLSYAISGAGTLANPASADPFYVYTITSFYPPVAFVQLTSASLKVASIANTGGNNWEIVVGGQTSGFTTPPIVKCFSQMNGQGASGVYGFRVRDVNGLRTWDSTEKMLIIKAKLDFSTQSGSSGLTQEIALSGVTNPYVMSLSDCYQSAQSYVTGPGSTNTISSWSSGWYLSSGKVARRSRGFISYTYQDDTTPNSDILVNDRVYVIEGNNY